MDERAIKRLLITLAMAIVTIMIAKYFLVKAATNVGQAAERKRAVAARPAPPATTAEPAELPADPPAGLPDAASAVPAAEGLSPDPLPAAAQSEAS